MTEPTLLSELIGMAARRLPNAVALVEGDHCLTYAELNAQVEQCAAGLLALGIGRGERVAIYLEKRVEAVVASFSAALAGAVFVPVNPVLKAEQVAYILRDCNVRVLVTSALRLKSIIDVLPGCPDLGHVVLTDGGDLAMGEALPSPAWTLTRWRELLDSSPATGYRVMDIDLVSIFYTSGSTGSPKGVMLSHRNMVMGARSVASYLENGPSDRLLAVLPLSFDAGFSQLTTAFLAGARVVLLNHLMPRDVLQAMVKEKVTGLTAVPALYAQLAQLDWPVEIDENLRYFANTGGHMPGETLTLLRRRAPRAKPFLMYGLTEAFRSTYLPPEEVDRRPDSIGRAIPNAEIFVLRQDGTPCDPQEPGELVHRGALVALGYWNDVGKTAERFKHLPAAASGHLTAFPLPEYVVFSGDIVRADDEGFLYFVGRNDEMLKTSGYRVSPTEIEEILYATGLVSECAAFGIAHPSLGQVICAVVMPTAETIDLEPGVLLAECRHKMPAYMVPSVLEVVAQPLPRSPNGKIDRKLLASRRLALETQPTARP